MIEKYPASDYLAPPIKGYPGQPVTPDTAYVGCRVHHSDDWDGDLLGIEPDRGTAVVTRGDGDIWGSCPLAYLEIAPDNQPSPIGRDECGVRRANGVIERVAMVDGSHALVLEWCVDPTGGSGWEPVRDGPWVEVSALRARYAKVGTFSECESWKMEQAKPRYECRLIGQTMMLYDTQQGITRNMKAVAKMLNAADRKTEGGE